MYRPLCAVDISSTLTTVSNEVQHEETPEPESMKFPGTAAKTCILSRAMTGCGVVCWGSESRDSGWPDSAARCVEEVSADCEYGVVYCGLEKTDIPVALERRLDPGANCGFSFCGCHWMR